MGFTFQRCSVELCCLLVPSGAETLPFWRLCVTSLSSVAFPWVHCQSSLLIWCQGLPQVLWSLYRIYWWKVIHCMRAIATSIQWLLLGPRQPLLSMELQYVLLLNCSAETAFATGLVNSFTVKINSTMVLKGILDLLNQFFSNAWYVIICTCFYFSLLGLPTNAPACSVKHQWCTTFVALFMGKAVCRLC